MSIPSSADQAQQSGLCPKCGHQNPGAQKFCGDCGTSLMQDGSLSSDEAVRTQIRKLLKEEFADDKIVEVNITERVLDRITRWAKLLGFFAGIPLGVLLLLLTFLGAKKYSDLWELSSAAEQKIGPMVESAKTRAHDVDEQTAKLKLQTDNVQQRLSSLQPKLAELEAGSQKLAEMRASLQQALSKQAATDTKVASLEGDLSEIKNVLANSSNYIKGRKGYHPEAIVIHRMEGTIKAGGQMFADPGTSVSTHYGVGKNGTVFRFVPEEDSAFHAGVPDRPSWSLLKPGVNPNYYTIGITAEGFVDDAWTDAMYAATAKLIAEIARRWGIPIDRQHIIGHHEIRFMKSCPGSGVDLDRLVKLAKQQAEILGK